MEEKLKSINLKVERDMKISSSSKRVQILKVIWRRNEVNVDFVRH
jgi:hypothetical protein